MNYNELKEHASECQIAADEISFTFLKMEEQANTLAVFQSVCDFNIFWLYSIAPEVVLHINSIELLKSGIKSFKRKLSIAEILKFDFIINLEKFETFEDFINYMKQLKL